MFIDQLKFFTGSDLSNFLIAQFSIKYIYFLQHTEDFLTRTIGQCCGSDPILTGIQQEDDGSGSLTPLFTLLGVLDI